jgi:hypothetical protein
MTFVIKIRLTLHGTSRFTTVPTSSNVLDKFLFANSFEKQVRKLLLLAKWISTVPNKRLIPIADLEAAKMTLPLAFLALFHLLREVCNDTK